jgi:hypothetical protein
LPIDRDSRRGAEVAPQEEVDVLRFELVLPRAEVDPVRIDMIVAV